MRQKSSGFERIGDAIEESSMTLVAREAKDGGAVRPDEPPGAIEDLEAKRLRMFQQKETGAFLVSITTH